MLKISASQYLIPLIFAVILLAGIYLNSSHLAMVERSSFLTVSFRKYSFMNDGSLLITFTFNQNATVLDVEQATVLVDNKSIEPLWVRVFNSTSIIMMLPYNILYDMCALNKVSLINLVLNLRYMNYTVTLYTNDYYIHYSCKIDFRVIGNGSRFIVLVGNTPSWVEHYPYPVNVSVDLYAVRPHTGKIVHVYSNYTHPYIVLHTYTQLYTIVHVYSNYTTILYKGEPIVMRIPEYDYGYVRIRYIVDDKPVLKVYRIGSEK